MMGMGILKALTIALQVWSILCILGTLLYMLYVINSKGEYHTGALLLLFAPFIYIFSKNDTPKRKIIAIGILILSIVIQYVILKKEGEI